MWNQMTRRIIALLLVLGALAGFVQPAQAIVERPSQPVSGFFLSKLPNDYGKLEKFFASFKDGGANAVIVELRANDSGLDLARLPHLVYLAHQSGLKIYAIVPTRVFPAMLRQHPAWEDLRYDLGSGTLQPSGKLDLFHQQAAAFVVDLIKEVASYSVDAVLLGDDFFYADTEGMSGRARDAYTGRTGADPAPSALFLRTETGAGGETVAEYGEPFWKWAEFKRDGLLTMFQEIVKASLPVNPRLRFGLPMPFSTPVTTGAELLSRYSYDMTEFRKLDVDLYWISIAYRDLRARQGLTYRQTMELLSRIAASAVTAAKDPAKTVIALQTTVTSGKPLPYFEIEEMTETVKRLGDTGRAYIITPEAGLPATLTKKMFKR